MSGWDESSEYEQRSNHNECSVESGSRERRGFRSNKFDGRTFHNSNDDRNNRQYDRRDNGRRGPRQYDRRNNDDTDRRQNDSQGGRSFGNSDRRNKNNERNNYMKNTSSNSWDSMPNNETFHTSAGLHTIRVDTRFVGKIIGRGGSKIKELQLDSGARINVNRDNQGSQTEITLSGSEDKIMKALQLIEDLVLNDEYQPSRAHNERDHSNRSYENNSWSNNQNDNNSQRNNDFQYDNQQDSKINDKCESPEKLIDWETVYRQSDEAKAAREAKLPPIVKNVYTEDPEVIKMSAKEVDNFRINNMNISVSRAFTESEYGVMVHENAAELPIPKPVKTFEQAFRNYSDILKTIYNQNFEKPSPIQCQSWPVILSGEDLIGIAQTGTGKTLAFLLPAFIHIEAQPVPREEREGPSVLILSPTRELAQQIEKEITKYTYKDIKSLCVYGGGSRKDQLAWYNKNQPEILVGCPGRVDDFVSGKEILLDSVTYIVLDEADKMLELGFEPQIRKILMNIREDRQTIMTSATWPFSVRRLASQYTKNAVQVVVGSLDLTAVHTITQRIEIIDEEDKRERLTEFLSNMDPEDKVIVFCGKKSVTDDISSNLILSGIQCQSIHGDREQCDREQALRDLKSGEVRILIATDVAARGIDIADITHIFNYDFPKNIEEYVHRIGRTGRAGRSGQAISLLTRRDWANAADLIKILEEANQGVPQELYDMATRFEKKKQTDYEDRRGMRRGGGGGRGNRNGRGFGGRGGRRF